MNNFKSCVPCVCTGSGRKRVCEEHNISKCHKINYILDVPCVYAPELFVMIESSFSTQLTLVLNPIWIEFT